MTNEEAAKKVNELFDEKMFWDNSVESYNFELTKKHILDSIQENTKLKAEIEQIKEELAQLKPSEPKHKPQKFHRFKDGEHKDVDATMSAYNRGKNGNSRIFNK